MERGGTDTLAATGGLQGLARQLTDFLILLDRSSKGCKSQWKNYGPEKKKEIKLQYLLHRDFFVLTIIRNFSFSKTEKRMERMERLV